MNIEIKSDRLAAFLVVFIPTVLYSGFFIFLIVAYCLDIHGAHDKLIMLIISAVLEAAFIVGMLFTLCFNRIYYKFTDKEIIIRKKHKTKVILIDDIKVINYTKYITDFSTIISLLFADSFDERRDNRVLCAWLKNDECVKIGKFSHKNVRKLQDKYGGLIVIHTQTP